MIWKTAKGNFLIQGKMEQIPYKSSGFNLPSGEFVHDAAPYYEISPEGKVLKKYSEPDSFSESGEMWVWFYIVIETSLLKYQWYENYPYERTLRAVENPLLIYSGLINNLYRLMLMPL